MSRYVVLRREREKSFYYEKSEQPLPHPLVYEPEPVKTGLLDKDGNSIYRLPDGIGFLRKPD